MFYLFEMKNIVYNFIVKFDFYVEDLGIIVIKKIGRVYIYIYIFLSKKKKLIILCDVVIELYVCVMWLFSMEVIWL